MYIPEPMVAQCFLDSFPGGFLAQVPPIVKKACEIAANRAQKFPAPEAHYIRPHLRRAIVESSLRAQASVFGLHSECRINAAKNAHHTFIAAPPFSMTANQVDTPETLTRPALFRAGYALQSQIDCFITEAPVPVDSVYGILLYRVHPKKLTEPAFARVRFPVHDFSGYLDASVDLLHIFGLASTADIPMEVIDEAMELEIDAMHLHKTASGE
jgi:hypothetical protein